MYVLSVLQASFFLDVCHTSKGIGAVKSTCTQKDEGSVIQDRLAAISIFMSYISRFEVLQPRTVALCGKDRTGFKCKALVSTMVFKAGKAYTYIVTC